MVKLGQLRSVDRILFLIGQAQLALLEREWVLLPHTKLIMACYLVR